MGKFATYRKRGSITPSAMLPAPGPGDWEFRYSEDNLQARFVVNLPVGAAYCWFFSYYPGGGLYLTQGSPTKDDWISLGSDPDSGTYSADCEWRNSAFEAISPKSARKSATV